MVYRVSRNDPQRFLALLEFLLVMKPCQVLRPEDHEPLLHLLVRFVALLGQHATFDDGVRILEELICYLLNYQALL